MLKLSIWLYCLKMVSIFATENTEIIVKYKLDVGQYLQPARSKVQLKDWQNPDIEDYKILQNYLSFAPRPELQYLNYPGTVWRERRIRNFRLIDDFQAPKFEILCLNNSPSEKKKCIVVYVSFDDGYIKKLNELIERLKIIGFDGHLIYRIGGWPYTEEGSLELFDIPYVFKILAILEAKKMGYENCLWLDSCMVPLKKLDPIFEHLSEHGVIFHANPAYSMKDHLPGFAAEVFEMPLLRFLQIPAVSATFLGVNFINPRGRNLIESWYGMAKEKRLGFLSFIPEQAVLNCLIDKFNLFPYAANPNYFADSSSKVTQNTILLWNHQ